MPDTKTSALTALTGAATASDDVIPIVDTSATTTKKITVAELTTKVGIGGTAVDLTGLADGNSLVYNSGSSKFVAASALSITPGSPGQGDVLTYNSEASTYGPVNPNPYNFATNDMPAKATTAIVMGAANRTYWGKVLYGPQRGCTKIAFRPGTVISGNITVGVATRGTGVGPLDIPQVVKVTSGSIAHPASGEVTFGTPFDVEIGEWLFISCDNNTATFYASVTAGGSSAAYLGNLRTDTPFNPSGTVSGLTYNAETKVFPLTAY